MRQSKLSDKKTVSFHLRPVLLLAFLVSSASSFAITPQPNWSDSYSANGKCYCASTFDHDIGTFLVSTPAGTKTVKEVCDRIGAGPGQGKNPVYNDIQCGNGPANNAGDESPGQCPGRVDLGEAGCSMIGPKWDLSVFGGSGNGKTFNVPGKVEMEDYVMYYDVTSGNQGGVYRNNDVDLRASDDVGGGYVLGWTDGNEWLEYDLNIAQAGSYLANLRLAALGGNGKVTLQIDGANVTPSVSVAATGGWNVWKTSSLAIGNLSSGKHRLRLQVGSGGFDLNWIDLQLQPLAGIAIPGKFQAESYNRFYDTTAGNTGGKFRNDNVDIESAADAGGGFNVGWIDGNEWLEYDVNVTSTKNYTADVRVASIQSGGMFTLEVDGVTKGNTFTINSTGGWQSWKTLSTNLGSLSQGKHTIRIKVQSGLFNINWVELRATP